MSLPEGSNPTIHISFDKVVRDINNFRYSEVYLAVL